MALRGLQGHSQRLADPFRRPTTPPGIDAAHYAGMAGTRSWKDRVPYDYAEQTSDVASLASSARKTSDVDLSAS